MVTDKDNTQRAGATGTLLASGDTIKTALDTQVAIGLASDTFLHAHEDTTFVLSSNASNEVQYVQGRLLLSTDRDAITLLLPNSETIVVRDGSIELDDNVITVLRGNHELTTQAGKFDLKFASQYDFSGESTELDIESYKKDPWIKWNIIQASTQNIDLGFLAQEGLPESIILDGQGKKDFVNLTWIVETKDENELNPSYKYRVLLSQEEDPTYPESQSHLYSSVTASADKWTDLEEGTYYFRVALIDENEEVVMYSNTVVIPVGANTPEIAMNANAAGDNIDTSWELTNVEDYDAIRVLYGETTPTYPNSEYIEIKKADLQASKYRLENILNDSPLFVRVCLVQSGRCIAYSNSEKIIKKVAEPKITLTHNSNSRGSFSWKLQDFDSIQISSFTLFVEGTNSSATILESGILNTQKIYDVLNLEQDKAYTAKICAIVNGDCEVTSNTVTLSAVTTSPAEEEPANSDSFDIPTSMEITLQGAYVFGKAQMSWAIPTAGDFESVRLIRSSDSSFASIDETQYISPANSSYAWELAPGTHYIQACVIINDDCAAVSNTVKIIAE
jgi:hypothetical protein